MTSRWQPFIVGVATAVLLAILGLFTPVIAPGPIPAPKLPPLGAPVAAPRERLCPGRFPLPGKSVLRVGGAITPPQRLVYVAPVYPVAAKASGVSGVVIVEAVIDADGTVHSTRVLRSIALLDDAAADAVCRWKFVPARLRSRSVPVALTVTVEF